MLINVLLFILGLIFLVKGSDFFVKSAASIAKKLGVSEFIIGLTLVAIGTSMPELASAVIASLKQQSGIIIGNVVGANILNIGLITGVASSIAIIKTKEEMLKRDGYIMLLAALLFYLTILNRTISWMEGMLFLLLYLVYIAFLLETKKEFEGKYHFREFINYFFGFKYIGLIKGKMLSGVKKIKKEDKPAELSGEGLTKDILILIISGFVIVLGANYFVNGAIFLANLLDIPKTLVGITIVSLGTTLPELSVTVSAARKGYGNIAVGNIIGSNIANIFLVLGVSALIFPLSITELTLFGTGPFMILMSTLLLIFIKSDWELRRKEGIIFLILYLAFIAVLLLTSI